MSTNRRKTGSESGYTVLTVMIGIAIVTIALVGHAMLAGLGALASRKARNEVACRMAAADCLHRASAAEEGGSLPPSPPVAGWNDTVYLDSATGQIVASSGESPADAALIARQWRRGRDAAGRPVVEVCATAVDDAGRPLTGRMAASVSFSERVR